MRVRLGGMLAAVAIVLSATAGSAYGASWGGTDPSANFPMGDLPADCWSDPTGTVCTDTGVDLLNQARASLGQPAYVLPADFDTLSPAQQLFILSNDDRTVYGLPAVPGLTDALNQAAAKGVQTDNDPWPTGSTWQAYTSNWAGGYANAVLAYEGWMYDDGPGSGNLDCSPADSSGCWGHRHDILWNFDGQGSTAMGAAAGADSGGMASFAMMLVQGDSSYQPTYSYTWAQAVADGAGGDTGSNGGGTGSGDGTGSTGSDGGGTGSGSGSGSSGSGPGSSGSGTGGNGSGSGGPPKAHGADLLVTVRHLGVREHRIFFRLTVPRGLTAHCLLRHWGRGGWHTDRSKRCTGLARFRHVRRGHYRLRIISATGTILRRVAVL